MYVQLVQMLHALPQTTRTSLLNVLLLLDQMQKQRSILSQSRIAFYNKVFLKLFLPFPLPSWLLFKVAENNILKNSLKLLKWQFVNSHKTTTSIKLAGILSAGEGRSPARNQPCPIRQQVRIIANHTSARNMHSFNHTKLPSGTPPFQFLTNTVALSPHTGAFKQDLVTLASEMFLNHATLKK